MGPPVPHRKIATRPMSMKEQIEFMEISMAKRLGLDGSGSFWGGMPGLTSMLDGGRGPDMQGLMGMLALMESMFGMGGMPEMPNIPLD